MTPEVIYHNKNSHPGEWTKCTIMRRLKDGRYAHCGCLARHNETMACGIDRGSECPGGECIFAPRRVPENVNAIVVPRDYSAVDPIAAAVRAYQDEHPNSVGYWIQAEWVDLDECTKIRLMVPV